MRQPPRTALVIIWNIAAVMALLGAAEFTARAIQFHRFGPNSQRPRELRDPYTFWRNNPTYGDRFIHHNAQGFRRDKDTPLEKPANTVRVFVLGGSVAYGWQGFYREIDNRPPPRNDETIDHYLEQELNARFQSRHWEAINAAVPAYQLHQNLALLLSMVLRYKPDYVVCIDGHNDIGPLLNAPPRYDPYRIPARETEFNLLANPASLRSLGVFGSAWLRNNSVLFRAIHDSLDSGLDRFHAKPSLPSGPLKNPVRWDELTPVEQNQFRVSASQLDSYVREVRQIHEILALDRVRDVFVLQPELLLTHKRLGGTEVRLDETARRVQGNLYVYGLAALYPKLATELTAEAQARGYRFVNLTDAFDGMQTQAFTDLCHLTPEGNRVVATRIFASLVDSLNER